MRRAALLGPAAGPRRSVARGAAGPVASCRPGGAAPPARPPWLAAQRRELHAALVAAGLGDALAALPGAGRDRQGHITVPVPDPRLQLLAELERTKPVPAAVEVAELGPGLREELVGAVEGGLRTPPEQAELSGKLLAGLREAEALLLAVPCGEAAEPVRWLEAAERALVAADLQALEQQVCKGGSSGPQAELDTAKLQKALATAKDKAVKQHAEELVRDVLAPGLESLRARLRAGEPARDARPGLGRPPGTPGAHAFPALDGRFEDLARSWLSVLVTWKPLFVLADVPEAAAGDTEGGEGGPLGNEASRQLLAHAAAQGVPGLAACVALEGEAAALREEPEFLAEYLASLGLRSAAAGTGGAAGLRAWRPQAPELARRVPRLLNLQTYYTAGEKEARAWLCPRVRKDGSPLAFALLGPGGAGAKAGKATGKGAAGAEEDGVCASVASRAIHTSFEARMKSVLVWKFEDLEALAPSASGPGAKERAKSAGKMRKLGATALLEEGDVVEFNLT